MHKGIDVSEFNGDIDWLAVYHAGFDFAICRTGYGKSGIDPTWFYNEGAESRDYKAYYIDVTAQ